MHIFLSYLLFVFVFSGDSNAASSDASGPCNDLTTLEECYFDEDCYWDHRQLNDNGLKGACKFFEHLAPKGCAQIAEFTKCKDNEHCFWISSEGKCASLDQYTFMQCKDISTESSCWRNQNCYYDIRNGGSCNAISILLFFLNFSNIRKNNEQPFLGCHCVLSCHVSPNRLLILHYKFKECVTFLKTIFLACFVFFF